MALGTIMEIGIFLIGLYEFFFQDKIIGGILMGVVILLWLLGLYWDHRLFKDKFYSWKQLRNLWN